MRQIWNFCRKIYDPVVHLYFALNWGLSFAIYLMYAHKLGMIISWHHLLSVVTLFLMLFILRILDEIKDYDYDKVYNLDRPLVTGEVSHRLLWIWVFILSMLTLSLNFLGPMLASFILFANILYGIGLIFLEKKVSWVRDHLMMNLLVTYPVNIALSFYLLSFYRGLYQLELLSSDYLMIAAFATNFLYYEFARKMGPRHLNQAGEKLYSDLLGMKGAIFLALVFCLSTVLLLMIIFQSNLPALLVIAPIYGLIELRKSKKRRPMMLSGSLFLGLFYAAVFVLSWMGI